MVRRKFVEYAAGRIERAVIDGDYFQMRIVDPGESRKGRGELFSFIPRGKNKRDAWACRILSWFEIFEPREFCCAIRDADAMEHPEGGNQGEKNEPKNVHEGWYRVTASGYPNM